MLYQIYDLIFDPDAIRFVTVNRNLDGQLETLNVYYDGGVIALSGGKAQSLYSYLVMNEKTVRLANDVESDIRQAEVFLAARRAEHAALSKCALFPKANS